MKSVGFVGVFLFLVCVLVCLGGVGYVGGWFTDAAGVAKDEFGPRNALVKYEWFKDASAALDAKAKNISVYEADIKRFENDYEGVLKKDWSRTDADAYNLKQQELIGLKASYNNLVAEYNANSKKFNWNFANVDNIPQNYTEK